MQLMPLCSRASAELIVVRAGPAAEVSALMRAFPGVRFVQAPADSGIPQLRGLGMNEAGGDIVTFTDDGSAPAPDWLASLVRPPRAAIERVDSAPRARESAWPAFLAQVGILGEPRKGRRDS